METISKIIICPYKVFMFVNEFGEVTEGIKYLWPKEQELK